LKIADPAPVAAEPIGSIISRMLSRARWGKDTGNIRVFQIWNSVVGPDIARHAQPDDLRQGKLFVRVDSSAWLAQLDRYLKRSIIKKINDKLDSRAVVNIIFRSGEVKPFTD